MQKYQDVKTREEFGIKCICYALNNEVGSVADLLHLRNWRTATVRKVSFRNSLLRPIYVINSVHKSTLSCHTSLLPFPSPHPLKGSTAKVTPFIQVKVSTIAFPHSETSRLGILYPHNSPNFFFHISINHNTLNRYSNRKHRKRRKIVILIM